MPRVPMIETRDQASDGQVETFDHIAASRGRMIRPFAAMIHRPDLAKAAADVGAVIRFAGQLTDHDRELVIVTCAIEFDCAFEWDSHAPLAEAAGVSPATLAQVRSNDVISDHSDDVLVGFVRELARARSVSEPVFEAAEARLGRDGVVELATVVGYYSMLALFMNAVEAC